MRILTLACCLLAGITTLAATTRVGDNLLGNGGFETYAENKLPDGWSFKLNPPGIAIINGDTEALFAGAAAMKIALPDTGTVNLDSTPVAVEAEKTYLFSIVARSEGFGEKAYAGVTAATSFRLLSADNKVIASIRGVQFPYTPSPWKMQDCLLTIPAGVVKLIVNIGFGNSSMATTQKNIPSTLWLDHAQLRQLTIADPPADTASVTPALATMMDTKTARIIDDPLAAGGKAITTMENETKSVYLVNTPYFPIESPSLQRAVLRCRVTDNTKDEIVGRIVVSTQSGLYRSYIDVRARDFAAPNVYQDIVVNTLFQDKGKWNLRFATQGTQPVYVESLTSKRIDTFDAPQLLELYPLLDKLPGWAFTQK